MPLACLVREPLRLCLLSMVLVRSRGQRVAQNSELSTCMRALKIACHGHRAAWTNARTPCTNKPLWSIKQTLLRILSSEKAMITAVAELVLPIMAMAISSTARCANASNLPLWQITHRGRSERIPQKVPLNFTCGSRHDPLAMSAWSLNSKRERFFLVSFWLGLGVS